MIDGSNAAKAAGEFETLDDLARFLIARAEIEERAGDEIPLCDDVAKVADRGRYRYAAHCLRVAASMVRDRSYRDLLKKAGPDA